MLNIFNIFKNNIFKNKIFKNPDGKLLIFSIKLNSFSYCTNYDLS